MIKIVVNEKGATVVNGVISITFTGVKALVNAKKFAKSYYGYGV